MKKINELEKVLTAANSYIPLAQKIAFVEHCAVRCLDTLNVQAKQPDETTPLPPMYKENTARKSRYLMGALARLYLRADYEPAEGDEWLPAQDDYDMLGALHILNRIERAKSVAALRDKCFDLLQDYRDLEKRLNTEVYGLLQVMNDPVSRLVAAISAGATPESLQASLAELEKLKTELADYQQQKAAQTEEGEGESGAE